MNRLIIQKRRAGFFSDFNLITAALTYLKENNISNFSFIWNNIYYSENFEENLFDKYFFKNINYDNYDIVQDIGEIGGSLFGHFNPDSVWYRANDTLHYFKYFENPIYKLCYEQCFKSDNTLGVHVRGTDHYMHGSLLDLDYYFNHIEKELASKNYANIFLATDEIQIVEKFHDRYGDMVKTNTGITRSADGNRIHRYESPNKDQLAIDVIKEGISLANCSHILITSSNVSGYSLCINPEVSYNYIDKHIEYR